MLRNSIYNRNYRKRNPEKARAHWIVSDALRRGHLFRGPCEKCQNLKVQAHHDDYSKPLAVRWLCSRCHNLEHGKLGTGPRPGTSSRGVYIPIPRELWKYHFNKRIEGKPKAETLRQAGKSYKQIGHELDVSQGTVYKWLNPVQYK